MTSLDGFLTYSFSLSFNISYLHSYFLTFAEILYTDMQEFELTKDFIELNKLMKILSWVNSGGQANMIISDGEVYLNDKVETQKRKKIRSGDVIRFMEHSVIVK